MFELIPGTGVVLPAGAGLLRFGLEDRATGRTLAALGDARAVPMLDATWSRTARHHDVELAIGSDEVDWDALEPTDPLLRSIVLSRARPASCGPAVTPVVLDGIDLFGHPATEVLDVLGRDLPVGLWLGSPPRRGYLTVVRLAAAHG
ncbi:hypothetical protein AB0D08_21490 [Kitasatospora sp. NPDC048540]|uniref:hypothetical protein n=1 Tax=unclassified Kitasatospora TaxID=2633591 RepID=UPI00053A1173|nr:hypothetical protein [Kitasatospora sp. MBT63]